MSKKANRILFYYDPAVLKAGVGEEGEKIAPKETSKTLKEKSAHIRNNSSGAAVLMRDASRFGGVESRVVGVVLDGDTSTECLDKVGKAYAEADHQVAFFSELSEDGASFEVEQEDESQLSSLKAKATELGINFAADIEEDDLAELIENHDDSDDDDSDDEFNVDDADFDAIKAYADENGIEYAPNIGEDTLRDRVRESMNGGE